jgi:FtsX-like permease family
MRLGPGGRSAIVLRRAFADRLVVLTAFAVVLIAATLVAAIPIYAHAVAESGLQERLARAPVRQVNVQVTNHVFDGGNGRAEERRVTRLARNAFAGTGTGASILRSGESEPFRIRGQTSVFGFFDGFASHVHFVSGRLPVSGTRHVEAVVPEAVARRLHLRVGELLRAQSVGDRRHIVPVRLVGIYRARRPASVYWWGDPLAQGGLGPFVTTRSSFFGQQFQDAELDWRLAVRTGRLTSGRAALLRHRLERLPGRLNAGQPSGAQFDVQTSLPDILAGAQRSLHLARAGVLVPSIQLALLAIYGLIVMSGLLTERRSLTTESLRLRGGTTSQIVALTLLEAILIAVPAVALAPLLASASLLALNHVGPLASIGLQLRPRVRTASYALAAAAALVCVIGLTVPVVLAQRRAVARERRRAPLAGLVQRSRLDLVVVAIALLIYWQMRHYHGVLVAHRGSLEVDPFLVAGPAILLLAGALLSLRLVPLAGRIAERAVGSLRGTVAPLGFWQLARRPRAYSRSVLLLVLAIAIGVFAATYSRTWHRSQVDQARYAAAADVIVEPPSLGGVPQLDLTSAYRSLGVDAALPVAQDTFDLAASGSTGGNLLAVDARRAATVVRPRRDFAPSPFPELLRRLARRSGHLASLPLPGRPTRLALTVRVAVEAPKAAPVEPAFPPPAYDPRPSLFLYLQDADGIVYLHRLGVAAGRTKRFTIELASRVRGKLARPRYPVSIAGLELDLDATYRAPGRATLELRSVEAGAGGQAQPVALDASGRWRARAVGFTFPYVSPRVGPVRAGQRSLRAALGTGATLNTEGQATAEFLLRPGGDSLPTPLPVLASDSFLRATHSSVGQVFPLALSGGTQSAEVVGSFRRFPTLDPATPAVLADLPAYLALSFAAKHEPVQPTAWWLKTRDPGRLVERLRGAPFGSVGIVSRQGRERALLEDPIPLGVIGALALGFVVAAAFAVVGFAAGAASTARSRTLEFAVLRSLGLQTRQLTGWIALENVLVVLLSALGGTALGILVSWLVLPYVALGGSGAAPVPPVELAVPWETVLAVELALLVALAAIAAAQVLLARRIRLAPALRAGEGALVR